VRFVTAPLADSWHKQAVTVSDKPGRPATAPALFRLLAESALSRAALGCCGVPVAMVEAAEPRPKARLVSYANAAFEALFGYAGSEICGRPLATLFHNDEALVQRVLEGSHRWQLTTWSKDGTAHPVEITVAAVRSVEGKLTHWVLAFADRGEVEQLRAEVESLKTLAASSLALRLDPSGQPAGGAQQARVEVAPADELYADRKPLGILQQR
jgi:PAS domain S-box-containing protein